MAKENEQVLWIGASVDKKALMEYMLREDLDVAEAIEKLKTQPDHVNLKTDLDNLS